MEYHCRRQAFLASPNRQSRPPGNTHHHQGAPAAMLWLASPLPLWPLSHCGRFLRGRHLSTAFRTILSRLPTRTCFPRTSRQSSLVHTTAFTPARSARMSKGRELCQLVGPPFCSRLQTMTFPVTARLRRRQRMAQPFPHHRSLLKRQRVRRATKRSSINPNPPLHRWRHHV